MKTDKRTFSQLLLIYLGAVVGVFVLVASVYEFRNEHNYKKAVLATRMEGYADLIAADDLEYINSKEELRFTILAKDGTVIYDSDSKGLETNHHDRPEIQACRPGKIGWAIRHSESSGRDFCYLAKSYGDRIVRVAIPYELDVKHFLRPNAIYIFLGVILLLSVLVAIGLVMLKNYRQLEVALERVRNEKQENKRIKHDMTHNIAHELRTPVSSMRGYLEAIIDCDDLDPDRKKLFIQRAYLQSLRLSDLLRDISLVTKIEESPELIKVENVNLREIVNGVIDEFEEKLSSHGMAALNLLPENCSIIGGPSLIYAIFRNLVENSCKYAGDGTMIRICLTDAGDTPGTVSLRYSDNGRGVAPAMLERIFERFFRIGAQSPSDYRDDVGSGLGLSVVRNAVQFHGGTIRASIPEEGGLEFDFTLHDVIHANSFLEK